MHGAGRSMWWWSGDSTGSPGASNNWYSHWKSFTALGIDFVSHQEALDTSTPMGRAMFTIIAALAELEGSVIRERVAAGLEYAASWHAVRQGSGPPKSGVPA